VWGVVEKLRKQKQMTVFLTTHYMEEASEADYVVIIDSGKKVAEGTPIDLKNKYTGDFAYVYGVNEDDVKSLGVRYEKSSSFYKLILKNTEQATELITKFPHVFKDYEITKGKMDSVFLAVTGKTLSGDGVK
jgi:multidrug/hemolysin transport system ATP-binding protein